MAVTEPSIEHPPVFEAAGETAVWLTRWGPPTVDTAVLATHGATSHGGWFRALGHQLARQGVATFALDRRGSGQLRSLGTPPEPEAWVKDLFRAVEIVKGVARRVVLLPWCFSNKIVVPALARGLSVDRTIFLAPAFFATQQTQQRRQERRDLGLEEFPIFMAIDDFVETPELQDEIERDPLRWRTMSRKFAHHSDRLDRETHRLLPELKVPMSAIVGIRDKLIDSARTKDVLQGLGHRVSELQRGHGFFIDAPAEAASAICEHL